MREREKDSACRVDWEKRESFLEDCILKYLLIQFNRNVKLNFSDTSDMFNKLSFLVIRFIIDKTAHSSSVFSFLFLHF